MLEEGSSTKGSREMEVGTERQERGQKDGVKREKKGGKKHKELEK